MEAKLYWMEKLSDNLWKLIFKFIDSKTLLLQVIVVCKKMCQFIQQQSVISLIARRLLGIVDLNYFDVPYFSQLLPEVGQGDYYND